jgi:signal transduction histidine kinase
MEGMHEPGTRILIVDGESDTRRRCRRALVSMGHTVDAAADLTTGLDLVSGNPYDLFLIDATLPDGSGLDLVDLIRQHDTDVTCIILTDYATSELAIEAAKRGVWDFLLRPFSADHLIVAVNQCLERRRLKAIEAQATELAQAKAELEKLDETKSQFMLKVAHELRAPVAAVQSYINLILRGWIPEDETQPALRRVQVRLDGMLDLISDLIELARLRQAKEEFFAETSPQPMADILQKVCDLLQERVHEKKQNFQVEIAARPIITADGEHLKQIWTNLISNAIKYTAEGGRIAVSLQTDSRSVVGTVEDSGIGISEEDLPNLFREFFRTDEAKASGEIGTGLGLSIVKQIVESYGGRIEVTSKLAHGSRFTFILPLEPAFEVRTEEHASAPVSQTEESAH